MPHLTVIDTNVFVAALMKGDGVNRKILELAFRDEIRPVMGDALYLEYESLLGREHLYAASTLNEDERYAFFDDFCSICKWTEVHYRWRPNLRDEGDNHVIELALAAGASTIITNNIKDFRGGDLVIPDLRIIQPGEFVRGLRERT